MKPEDEIYDLSRHESEDPGHPPGRPPALRVGGRGAADPPCGARLRRAHPAGAHRQGAAGGHPAAHPAG